MPLRVSSNRFFSTGKVTFRLLLSLTLFSPPCASSFLWCAQVQVLLLLDRVAGHHHHHGLPGPALPCHGLSCKQVVQLSVAKSIHMSALQQIKPRGELSVTCACLILVFFPDLTHSSSWLNRWHATTTCELQTILCHPSFPLLLPHVTATHCQS